MEDSIAEMVLLAAADGHSSLADDPVYGKPTWWVLPTTSYRVTPWANTNHAPPAGSRAVPVLLATAADVERSEGEGVPQKVPKEALNDHNGKSRLRDKRCPITGARQGETG